MKANETQLLQFFREAQQFTIPIYQRTYSWTETECAQLWDDIMRTGRSGGDTAHFFGSVVYILFKPVFNPQLVVIDGQQRLTTVSLIIEALARELGDDEPVDGFSKNKLRNRYLRDQDETGESGYKLILTQTDKETLLAIVDNKDLPDEHSLRLEENFNFFREKVKKLNSDFKALCLGLSKLEVVSVALVSPPDNPQLIFESMNSTGRKLSQADLIRNFVLMGLKPNEQETLYNDHWRKMETAFGQKAYDKHFDGFMRHYLTVKNGEIPRIDDVYEEFKKLAHPYIEGGAIKTLVADVHTYAKHYCAMALGKKISPELAAVFADLRELKADVVYPLLLVLYHDYYEERLSKEDLAKAVRLVESYVFRRAVCAIPTNSMNKTFAGFGRALKKDRYLESIQAHFLLLPSYRRFPGDEEFHQEIKVRDLYNIPRLSYWLRRLENHKRKELVSVNEYTVEHVMPQTLTDEWVSALGDDWKRIHDTLLHTLGNLTLTGYNPEYSNRSFIEKRNMDGGFKDSPIRVNKELGVLESWNETEIHNRAKILAQKALDVWQSPSMSSEDLVKFVAETLPMKTQEYTIEYYRPLADGSPMRMLFDTFTKEVLALYPNITREFVKSYIAHKAETNFVDVIPQTKRLKLILNLSFHELRDPRGLARDVSGIGSPGNGDVEVHLKNSDDLPYVMGLVRQAFEKQMGEEEGA